MADNLIPPQSSDNESRQYASDKNPCHEGGSNPIKEIAAPNGNNGIKPNSIWILLGALDAGGVLLFWGYSEFFGNHNSPILSNICFFGFTASVLAAIAGFTFKHWPHAVTICLLYILLCCCSGIVIYEYAKSSSTNDDEHIAWQPPELPKDCKKVHILIGTGIEVEYSTDSLTNGPFSNVDFVTRTSAGGFAGVDLSGKGVGGFEIKAFIKNNRLYVQVPLPLGLATNQLPILMNDDVDAMLPGLWDRNYNSNAFEIVDGENLPVLQVIYKRPDDIQVNGIFAGTNGLLVGFGKGQIFMPVPSVLPEFPERKALFLYPASLHRGEIATFAVMQQITTPRPTSAAEPKPVDADNSNDIGLLSIEIGDSLDSKWPFQTKFIIQNVGSSEISNISGAFMSSPNLPEIHDIYDYTNGWHRALYYGWHTGTLPSIDKLEPRAKFAVNLKFFPRMTIPVLLQYENPVTASDGSPISTNAILLQITCNYETPPLQLKKRETFKFYAEPDSDKSFHWFPLGYGEVWSITNIPKISE